MDMHGGSVEMSIVLLAVRRQRFKESCNLRVNCLLQRYSVDATVKETVPSSDLLDP